MFKLGGIQECVAGQIGSPEMSRTFTEKVVRYGTKIHPGFWSLGYVCRTGFGLVQED